MLKKLVKYGNSNALVLDRSILSLLDIEEGSVVKLRVEGDTLIVKGEKAVKPTDSLTLEYENIQEVMACGTSSNRVFDIAMERNRKFCEKAKKDPKIMANLKEWAPGSEGYQKLQEAYKKIIAKYSDEVKIFGSKEFQDETAKLNKKYEGNASSEEYIEEFLALRLKYAPGVTKMDKEMKEVNKALSMPEDF